MRLFLIAIPSIVGLLADAGLPMIFVTFPLSSVSGLHGP